MVPRYRAVYEIRGYESARDRDELERALMVFARNMSPVLRTQTNQILFKFEHPNNPSGTFYFVGLYQNAAVVGFAMFGYYPRRRVVAIDHVAIEANFRKHGSFYVFSALLQQFIEERCPGYDYVVAEIATDNEFADDEVSGRSLVRLLRQLGFGQAQVRYDLANIEPRNFRRTYRAALMIRGAQKITQIRSETLLDIYEVILFEHYLPWYRDFFGERFSDYEKYLKGLYEGMKTRLQSVSTVVINGGDHDELPKPTIRPKISNASWAKIGHVIGFVIVSLVLALIAWALSLHDKSLIAFPLVAFVIYVGLMAQTNVRSMKVFEKVGEIFTRLVSGK